MAASDAPGAMFLTGEAGTGKTHVLAVLARLLEQRGGTMAVLAVAHRAVHNVRSRLYSAGLENVRFATVAKAERDVSVVRGADVVVVDEASMVASYQLRRVMRHVPKTAVLLLAGDPYQLPPIDPGRPFEDAMRLGVPGVHLQRQYGQAERGGVREFSRLIREQGCLSVPLPGCVSIQADLTRTTEALATAVQGYSLSSLVPMVLTWRRDDWIKANLVLQAATNQGARQVFAVEMRDSTDSARTVRVRLGDRVVVTRNILHFDLYNGMTGVLTDEDDYSVSLELDDGRCVQVPRALAARSVELGFCLTVHRAQGGQWPHVIVYQPKEVREAPHRWYYTALSRAQERLTIITSLSVSELWANATGVKRSAARRSRKDVGA